MHKHADQTGPDEDSQVLADGSRVEFHDVGKDEEKHADGCEFDEEDDDFGDDFLDFDHRAHDAAAGIEKSADDDGGDQHGQELVFCKCLDDVSWDEGVEDVDENGGDVVVGAFVD